MAAAQYTLTDTAWTDLGACPSHVQLDDARDVRIAVGLSAPSNASKVGTLLSMLPPRVPFFDATKFANTQKVFARAETDKGASVVVQREG